ncbi:MAG: 50S ribosomal protein L13 [Patescibacteria group bacterium]|nr:50S ribosomal protein L13 [Patescibacteria group bacterium]
MEHIIDATNKKMGRLASEVAGILQNKNSAYYESRLSGNGKVIIKNIDKLDISPRKMEQKVYYRHTGYMGHLKEKKLKELFAESPAKVLRKAVQQMLPKNSLQPKRMRRLIIEK